MAVADDGIPGLIALRDAHLALAGELHVLVGRLALGITRTEPVAEEGPVVEEMHALGALGDLAQALVVGIEHGGDVGLLLRVAEAGVQRRPVDVVQDPHQDDVQRRITGFQRRYGLGHLVGTGLHPGQIVGIRPCLREGLQVLALAQAVDADADQHHRWHVLPALRITGHLGQQAGHLPEGGVVERTAGGATEGEVVAEVFLVLPHQAAHHVAPQPGAGPAAAHLPERPLIDVTGTQPPEDLGPLPGTGLLRPAARLGRAVVQRNRIVEGMTVGVPQDGQSQFRAGRLSAIEGRHVVRAPAVGGHATRMGIDVAAMRSRRRIAVGRAGGQAHTSTDAQKQHPQHCFTENM